MSGWAALGEAAMGLANTGLGLWAQSKAARRQWAQQKEALQNQHQWEVADLRKAGLNPMLSVNAGAGGASGGNAAFPQFDVGKNLNKFSESDLLKAQAGAAQAQEKANSAIAENQYEQSVLAGVASRNLAADTVLKQNSANLRTLLLIYRESPISGFRIIPILVILVSGFRLLILSILLAVRLIRPAVL